MIKCRYSLLFGDINHTLWVIYTLVCFSREVSEFVGLRKTYKYFLWSLLLLSHNIVLKYCVRDPWRDLFSLQDELVALKWKFHLRISTHLICWFSNLRQMEMFAQNTSDNYCVQILQQIQNWTLTRPFWHMYLLWFN